MFRLCHLVVLAALVCAQSGLAWAIEVRPPLLTLVYTANTLGEYRACPVCGSHAEGGLARRATRFKELRAKAGDRTLFLAGPYEFTPMVQRKAESPDLARALGQAYGRLGYDYGVLAPQEEQWLSAAQAPLPGAWQGLESGPRTVQLAKAGVKLAVVLFPVLDVKANPAAASAMIGEISAEARQARAGADLVVGLSPWGEAGEKLLLQAAPDAFDLLLGAGKAMGYGVRTMAEGHTIWVRPPFDGRGMVVLSLHDLPQGRGLVWEQGKTFDAQVQLLDWAIPEDPDVANLFSWL